MATTNVSPSPNAIETASRTRSRTALDMTVLVALAIVVLVDAGTLIHVGTIIPPVALFGTLYLVSTIVFATRWRWAPLFPLVICALGLVGELSTGYPVYVFTHPGFNNFASAMFSTNYPLLLLTICLSAVKLVQTLRHQDLHAPGWMGLAQGLAAGLIVGALLIGATIPAGSGSASATAAAAGTKIVHLGGDTFSPDIIALHTGDTLTLVGDAPVPHTIVNGTWDASKHAVPGMEAGAPAVNNVEVNNNTKVIGPFTTPGTYHIFCIVHPGMNLIVIVL